MNFDSVFLKMTWLNILAGNFVSDVLGLDTKRVLGGAIQFFIYDVVKIFILLSVLIFTISFIQSYFPPERTKKILEKHKGVKGNILGALLGTITPFCSCSSIPIFIGFVAARVPIGITFSFLISSPLVDLASVIMISSFFGRKVAIIYVLVGIILAVIGGLIIDKLKMEKYIEEFVMNIPNIDKEDEKMTIKGRIKYSRQQVIEIIKKVWLAILIGVGIGALIHNVIPREVIEKILGNNNPFAVIIATIIAIPMYADIFGTLPIAEALYLKGVGLGTILAFMIGVTALSFPSLVMLSKVIKPKLLWTFTGIVAVGIIIIGYLFNYVIIL